jgi:hypothetical protein
MVTVRKRHKQPQYRFCNFVKKAFHLWQILLELTLYRTVIYVLMAWSLKDRWSTVLFYAKKGLFGLWEFCHMAIKKACRRCLWIQIPRSKGITDVLIKLTGKTVLIYLWAFTMPSENRTLHLMPVLWLTYNRNGEHDSSLINGTVSRGFSLQVFFMNH